MNTLNRPIPAATVDRVAAHLRVRERAFRTRWTVLAIVGFAVVWVGPVIVATLIAFFQFRFGGSAEAWSTLFSWSCLVGIPVMFLLEYLTRGTFLERALDGLGDPDTVRGHLGYRHGGVFLIAI